MWLVLLFWDIKPPPDSPHPLHHLLRTLLRVSRRLLNGSVYRLGQSMCYFEWEIIARERIGGNHCTLAWVKKRLPACFRFASQRVLCEERCRDRCGLSITDVLSCSNLCCVSLLFVLLSFLLLCLYVSVQTRSKLLITSLLIYRILSVIHIRVFCTCLLAYFFLSIQQRVGLGVQ